MRFYSNRNSYQANDIVIFYFDVAIEIDTQCAPTEGFPSSIYLLKNKEIPTQIELVYVCNQEFD
jgi:hypothetical protein